MTMFATTLQDARVQYPNNFDKWELRGSTYGLLDKALANTATPTGVVSEEIVMKAKKSWGVNVDIPVMSPSAAANGTGLTCTYVGTESISNIVNITWVKVSNGFEMQPAKNVQNEISYAAEFARKYTDAIRKMAVSIDTGVYTAVNTARATAAQYSSTYVGAGNKFGALVGNAVQVSLANRENFFNDVIDIMAADDLYPRFDTILSTNGRSITRQLYAQGQSNDVNTQYQFSAGEQDFSFSNRLAVTSGSVASGFIMPKGAFGIVSRLRPDCEAGILAGTKQFGSVYDPTLGMMMGTLEYSDCGSIVAESNNADDATASRQYFQMEVIYGIMTAYNNYATSGVSAPIRKFDLLP